MAFLMTSALKSTLTNTTTSAMQSLVNKDDTKALAKWIKGTCTRHWKTGLVVGTGIALIAGAYKVHCDVVTWREQQELSPRESLSKYESLVDITEKTSGQISGILEEIGCEFPVSDDGGELEDVLEIDEPVNTWATQFEIGNLEPEEKLEGSALQLYKYKQTLKSQVRERKKIKINGQGVALRGLVAKARLAFPVPKATEMQAQAINLFLYKECRKLNIRLTDMAILIPRAVALAMIPSETQIESSQLQSLPIITKRFARRDLGRTSKSLTARVLNGILGFVNK